MIYDGNARMSRFGFCLLAAMWWLLGGGVLFAQQLAGRQSVKSYTHPSESDSIRTMDLEAARDRHYLPTPWYIKSNLLYKHKYYQLATIVPEVRYWFKPQGPRKGHYLGLFGGAGWYDLENGGRGYRGEGGMVGLSYGYMFPVGKYFAFEAGIGLGYAHLKYEEYLPIDGHYVYQQTDRTHYFGPLKLKFAFVWNIGRWTEKGGRK